MRVKPAVVNGAPRSDMNTNGDWGSFSRCTQFVAEARMGARGALLDSTDVQSPP